MVMSRALVLLCVAAAAVLSEGPSAGVSAELAPLRQLEEEVVKVHVKLHQDEVEPTQAKKPVRKQHNKGEEEEVTENGETVRNYDHGTVRIESKGQQGTHDAKGHHQKKATKKAADSETVVEYSHGSVKISDKKATDGETTSTKDKAKKAATPNEKEVTSTANQASELVTKLSSTTSDDKKSFIDAYGPVVVICGIIGGLAAIVGVAGLVVGQTKTSDDNLDSVLDTSADLDVDVEANITSPGVQQDDDAGGEDLLGYSSDSDAIDDEEEEGTFANGTAHVSV